jgi:hypothetical protein
MAAAQVVRRRPRPPKMPAISRKGAVTTSQIVVRTALTIRIVFLSGPGAWPPDARDVQPE